MSMLSIRVSPPPRSTSGAGELASAKRETEGAVRSSRPGAPSPVSPDLSHATHARGGKNRASDFEPTLLALWTRALGHPDITPHDNFFDLGGDSLMAVQLFLEIERETGVRLPVTAIYDAPTVEDMTRLLGEEAAPQASPLVLLKPGTGNPLFIVHGIGGTVIELAALGRSIGIAEPVYAIQAPGLDGRAAPVATVEAMADLYVEAIRSVEPHGPYRLCGYSFGGLIAIEMAKRLEADGQRVAPPILIDAYAHPSTWPLLSRMRMRARRTLHLAWHTRGRAFLETLSRFCRRLNRESESARLHEWLLDHNPSLPLTLRRVREAGGAALLAYRPRPYAGPVTFLKAGERSSEFPDDPWRIWQHLLPYATFRTIPGRHRTIVTDHAAAAAAALTACLSRAPQGTLIEFPPPSLRKQGWGRRTAKRSRGHGAPRAPVGPLRAFAPPPNACVGEES